MTPASNMNNLTGEEFVRHINTAYNTIIKWRPNLLKLPTGKAGKVFIKELTKWLELFNNNSEFRSIALQVYHTLPALLLQKPTRNSKAKDHLRKLEERLTLWNEGRIEDLIREGTTIQNQLTAGKPRSAEDTAKVFARLMLQGKVNAALNLLSSENSGGVLHLSDIVIKELKEKHPPPAPIQENTLLHGPILSTPSNYFELIDEQMILMGTANERCRWPITLRC